MLVTAWPRQIRIRGGSSETDAKELTVRPWGTPDSSITAAIATLVAKRPQAWRKVSGETGAIRLSTPSLDMRIKPILS